MGVEEIAMEQFEKFREELASSDISNDSPLENVRANLIHQLRVRYRPSGEKSANIFDTLCSNHLRNIDL